MPIFLSKFDWVTLQANGVSVRVAIINMTPMLAKQILECGGNDNFRNPTRRVEQYVRMMRNGEWYFNSVPIILDDKGRDVDGRHRLLACVISGCSFYCVVHFGVNEYRGIDEQAQRTARQHLANVGVDNAKIVANAVNHYFRMRSGQLFKESSVNRATSTEVLDEYNKDRDGFDEAVELCKCLDSKQSGRIIQAGLVAALMYYAFYDETLGNSVPDNELSREFVIGLATGVGLKTYSPVRVLRERLIRNKMDKQLKRKHYSDLQVRDMLIRAWNAFIADDTMTDQQLTAKRKKYAEPIAVEYIDDRS